MSTFIRGIKKLRKRVWEWWETLDSAPSVYFPAVCTGRSKEDIFLMEEENALPHGWEHMDYEGFLVERRELMSAKIKKAFEKFRNNV